MRFCTALYTLAILFVLHGSDNVFHESFPLYICLAALKKIGRDLAFRECTQIIIIKADVMMSFLVLSWSLLQYLWNGDEHLYHIVLLDDSAGLCCHGG